MRNSTLMRPMLVLYVPPPLSGRLPSFPHISLLSHCHIACTPAPSLIPLSPSFSLFHSSSALSLFHLHSLVIFHLLSLKPPPHPLLHSAMPFLFLLQNFPVGQLIIFPQTCYFLYGKCYRIWSAGQSLPPSPIKSVSCFLSH